VISLPAILFISLQVPRSADAHMDCSRKVYELSREIEETKICLERAGIGDRFPIKPYRPRGAKSLTKSFRCEICHIKYWQLVFHILAFHLHGSTP